MVSYYIEGLLRQMTAELAREYLGIEAATSIASMNGGLFKFSPTTTAADPGQGYVRINAATWAAATEAYVDSVTDANKLDATKFIALINTGDVFVIQDKSDASVYGRYTLSGPPVDNTGWFTIPLTHVKSAGSVPGNNKPIAVVVQYT